MPKGIYKRTKPSWNKGKQLTKEHKEKLKQTLKGKRNSPKTEFQKGFISWNAGKKKETDKRLNYNRPTSFKKGIRYSPKTEFEKGQKMPREWLIKRGTEKSIRKREKWKMLRKQATRPKPEQCEICGAFGSDLKKGLCFDHNHKTNKFRGWICGRCNFALGLVKENIGTLEAMIEYLKKDRHT